MENQKQGHDNSQPMIPLSPRNKPEQISLLSLNGQTHRSKRMLGPALKDSSEKKGECVISYNFDHTNSCAGLTHNIFIGWEDEPTIKRKKPISISNSKTPVRNRLIVKSNEIDSKLVELSQKPIIQPRNSRNPDSLGKENKGSMSVEPAEPKKHFLGTPSNVFLPVAKKPPTQRGQSTSQVKSHQVTTYQQPFLKKQQLQSLPKPSELTKTKRMDSKQYRTNSPLPSMQEKRSPMHAPQQYGNGKVIQLGGGQYRSPEKLTSPNHKKRDIFNHGHPSLWKNSQPSHEHGAETMKLIEDLQKMQTQNVSGDFLDEHSLGISNVNNSAELAERKDLPKGIINPHRKNRAQDKNANPKLQELKDKGAHRQPEIRTIRSKNISADEKTFSKTFRNPPQKDRNSQALNLPTTIDKSKSKQKFNNLQQQQQKTNPKQVSKNKASKSNQADKDAKKEGGQRLTAAQDKDKVLIGKKVPKQANKQINGRRLVKKQMPASGQKDIKKIENKMITEQQLDDGIDLSEDKEQNFDANEEKGSSLIKDQSVSQSNKDVEENTEEIVSKGHNKISNSSKKPNIAQNKDKKGQTNSKTNPKQAITKQQDKKLKSKPQNSKKQETNGNKKTTNNQSKSNQVEIQQKKIVETNSKIEVDDKTDKKKDRPSVKTSNNNKLSNRSSQTLNQPLKVMKEAKIGTSTQIVPIEDSIHESPSIDDTSVLIGGRTVQNNDATQNPNNISNKKDDQLIKNKAKLFKQAEENELKAKSSSIKKQDNTTKTQNMDQNMKNGNQPNKTERIKNPDNPASIKSNFSKKAEPDFYVGTQQQNTEKRQQNPAVHQQSNMALRSVNTGREDEQSTPHKSTTQKQSPLQNNSEKPTTSGLKTQKGQNKNMPSELSPIEEQSVSKRDISDEKRKDLKHPSNPAQFHLYPPKQDENNKAKTSIPDRMLTEQVKPHAHDTQQNKRGSQQLSQTPHQIQCFDKRSTPRISELKVEGHKQSQRNRVSISDNNEKLEQAAPYKTHNEQSIKQNRESKISQAKLSQKLNQPAGQKIKLGEPLSNSNGEFSQAGQGKPSEIQKSPVNQEQKSSKKASRNSEQDKIQQKEESKKEQILNQKADKRLKNKASKPENLPPALPEVQQKTPKNKFSKMVSPEDSISVANMTAELHPIEQQSFDSRDNNPHNNTQLLRTQPTVFQRKLNKNNVKLKQNKRMQQVRDRSDYDRAPILSQIYGDERRVIQDLVYENRLSSHKCTLEVDEEFRAIGGNSKNSIVERSISLVISIDCWLINRIIEPCLAEDDRAQAWLYCQGAWRPFKSAQAFSITSFFKDIFKQAAETYYKSSSIQQLGLQELIRMITGLRVMQLKNKNKLSQQLQFNLKKGHILKGLSSDPNKPIYEVTDTKVTPTNDRLIQITKQSSDDLSNEDDGRDDVNWVKESVFHKYFDYFLLICYRAESKWTRKKVAHQQDHTNVYTLDSLGNISGSIQLHSQHELVCQMDLYRQVRPKVLKFIGKINEKHRPVRSLACPNPTAYFDFMMKGRYYIFVTLTPPKGFQGNDFYLSLEGSDQIDINFLETVKNISRKNETSEYVEVGKKRQERGGGKTVKEQFIDYLMGDGNKPKQLESKLQPRK